ncbi:5'-methylthioadenosine/S-adenosylhomocysteine nucleosidase [Chromobacterium sp. IRSSSOUMB001]|uniref:5'-methylthioadenosine/S-adenosylhomocysteine nucleosidase family protein n=1 Tax=Chromobacterium sp. IRSSSOUMB001 TaxID=2927123 RepID=UPI0020BDEF9C|nr:5'-methylthioadenosine/S-adenosylhomocysteine nucleosidase [Chromobacterium sp. IRSSSOUMB001]
MNILLLSAFPAESAHLSQQLSATWMPDPVLGALSCRSLQYNLHQLYLAETGVGTEDAALTTLALLQQRDIDLVLFLGTSGAVGDGWGIGDVVAGNKVVQMDLYGIDKILKGTPFESCLFNSNTHGQLETEWDADPYWLAKLKALPRVKPGLIFSSNQFPVPADKFPAMLELGRGVIEMESSGVMRAARRVGSTPVLVLRAVSNIIDGQGQDTGTPEHGIELCAERLSATVLKLLSTI